MTTSDLTMQQRSWTRLIASSADLSCKLSTHREAQLHSSGKRQVRHTAHCLTNGDDLGGCGCLTHAAGLQQLPFQVTAAYSDNRASLRLLKPSTPKGQLAARAPKLHKVPP